MIKKISYLGLGTMGSGMVSNLLKAGYELTVWNRSVERNKPFARKGARVADTRRERNSKRDQRRPDRDGHEHRPARDQFA